MANTPTDFQSVFNHAIVSATALVNSINSQPDFWLENLKALQQASNELATTNATLTTANNDLTDSNATLKESIRALTDADEQLAGARESAAVAHDALNQFVRAQTVYKSTGTHSGPMDASFTGQRGPLAAEKERRKKLGLCRYCGQPGHIAKDHNDANTLQAKRRAAGLSKLDVGKPRAKAPPHVRKAVEAALITWRAERGAVEFRNSRLTQGGRYDVFLPIEDIREMTRNVHLVREWKDIEPILTDSDWPRRWLDKYGEELTALVISVAEKAQQDRKVKLVKSTNLPIATDTQGAVTPNPNL